MRHRHVLNVTTLFICHATALLAVGCVEPRATYCFRVIDADSAEPLKDVHVLEWWQGAHWASRLFPAEGMNSLTKIRGPPRIFVRLLDVRTVPARQSLLRRQKYLKPFLCRWISSEVHIKAVQRVGQD